MKLEQTDVVLRFWTALLDPKIVRRTGDWFCVIVAGADGMLRGEYRFRYSTTPGFDDSDEISRYGIGGLKDTPENRARAFDGVRELMATGGFLNVVEKEINGSPADLIKAMLDTPGLNIKTRELPVEEKS